MPSFFKYKCRHHTYTITHIAGEPSTLRIGNSLLTNSMFHGIL
nr:MAG TPA: hypothetical protein [Caudoviricetes sp.]